MVRTPAAVTGNVIYIEDFERREIERLSAEGARVIQRWLDEEKEDYIAEDVVVEDDSAQSFQERMRRVRSSLDQISQIMHEMRAQQVAERQGSGSGKVQSGSS